jgi:hypothetical protein
VLGNSQGGGLYHKSGTVTLSNVTITGNTAGTGGGLHKELGALISLRNTIIAGNSAADGPDCFNTLTSQDYNLIGDTTDCNLTGPTANTLTGRDPMLGPLQDNGGWTETHALLAGSPAIGAGNPAIPGSVGFPCETTDQRGVGRPQGLVCDIGAFELVDTFTDDDGNIFENDIEWMADEGITKGCNPPVNDRFCPASSVTRGQMAAFLVRALDLTDPLDDPFTDDDDSIFEADIEKLAAAGITKGCNPPTNDRFCPDSKVTRGQMAAFLVRAIGYVDDGGGDLFIDDDDSIFENDIDKLGTAGVTKGCNPPVNDMYCPGSVVTRGQMAAFLHRALG